MFELDQLIDKLRKLEALHAGAASDGERAAAAGAMDRIRQKLNTAQKIDPPVEFTFSLNNLWSRQLFCALLRRYGLEPYRYPRQRRTTVMARVPQTFVNETLWPEFVAIDKLLQNFLSDVTQRIIGEHVNSDTTDAEVRPGGPPLGITAREQTAAQ
ncbi:MAG: hypothetical protein EHM42_08875 [Planctomycetaceae bacterium]|nr:MAG: hypothetical protein EHM42_08875 [Planctomycetaceae bacterium]